MFVKMKEGLPGTEGFPGILKVQRCLFKEPGKGAWKASVRRVAKSQTGLK